jgi:hypothetical protein
MKRLLNYGHIVFRTHGEDKFQQVGVVYEEVGVYGEVVHTGEPLVRSDGCGDNARVG